MAPLSAQRAAGESSIQRRVTSPHHRHSQCQALLDELHNPIAPERSEPCCRAAQARPPPDESGRPAGQLSLRGRGHYPGRGDEGWLQLCDVTAPQGDPSLDAIWSTSRRIPSRPPRRPPARGQGRRTLDDGLVAESAAYSVLQSGPEFDTWHASRPPTRADTDDAPRLRIGATDARCSSRSPRRPLEHARCARCATNSSKPSPWRGPTPASSGSNSEGRAGRSVPAGTSTSSAPGPIRPRLTSSGSSAASDAPSPASASRRRPTSTAPRWARVSSWPPSRPR